MSDTEKLIARLNSVRIFLAGLDYYADAVIVADAAAALEAMELKCEVLRLANTTRPDYELHCDECGRAHILDTSLPSHIWNQIAKPKDILCLLCIDNRLAVKGLTAEVEFYYAGEALNSRLYAESFGAVQAAESALSAANAEVERLRIACLEAYTAGMRDASMAAQDEIDRLRKAYTEALKETRNE